MAVDASAPAAEDRRARRQIDAYRARQPAPVLTLTRCDRLQDGRSRERERGSSIRASGIIAEVTRSEGEGVGQERKMRWSARGRRDATQMCRLEEVARRRSRIVLQVVRRKRWVGRPQDLDRHAGASAARQVGPELRAVGAAASRRASTEGIASADGQRDVDDGRRTHSKPMAAGAALPGTRPRTSGAMLTLRSERRADDESEVAVKAPWTQPPHDSSSVLVSMHWRDE